jgi:hypothetical protein
VLCRVGLSLRGNGSRITHTLSSLPIPNIICHASRIKNLTATLCLTLALLTSNSIIDAATNDALSTDLTQKTKIPIWGQSCS